MAAPDRLQKLLKQNKAAGIDFVYVHKDQKTLDIFFFQHEKSPQAKNIIGTVAVNQIRIYASSVKGLPDVSVVSATWVTVDNRDVLRLTTAVPGDFCLYRLKIDNPSLDRYFNDVTFSFKAHCDSKLDCEPPEHECTPEDEVDFAVDYRARDFWSFRQALLDFASLRYPDWEDRLEADVGIMLAEVMSALGDELAYYQDRVAREAYLETATQRRSLRRHARLVDYIVHDGLGAATWLDVTVKSGKNGDIPAGADVWALSDSAARVAYEVDRGLNEEVAGIKYSVKSALNTLKPHIWDEDDTCLSVGTTELFVKGHHKADLSKGKWVLLKTNPKSHAIPERNWMVRLITVKETNDLVLSQKITHLVWEKSQALPCEIDLNTLAVRGNLVPVTAGKTQKKRFTIGPTSDAKDRPEAVEREGPDGSIAYLFSLPNSESKDLVWLPDVKSKKFMGKTRDTRSGRPEIRLVEAEFDGTKWVEKKIWKWRRSLLGTNSSQPYDRHFTLDDGVWKRVAGYRRVGKSIVYRDYAVGTGVSLRFGDGEFGALPAKGVFQVTYRLGNGRHDNLPADSITGFDKSLGFIDAVTNPFAATNGLDPETPQKVRQLAPDAFRAVTYRAVRPKDYAEAAQRLSWVQRAGTTFRWTGSWLSAFTTPDPKGAVTVTDDQRLKLENQLDRFRQAGREVHVADPLYADLDLEITICVQPDAYPGDTKEAVMEALLGKKGLRPRPGFFAPDNFTFGTPLKRSALEAAIQAVSGVHAVEDMMIRRRGWFKRRAFTELTYAVGINEVIRVENDRLHPERGSIKLITEGGA